MLSAENENKRRNSCPEEFIICVKQTRKLAVKIQHSKCYSYGALKLCWTQPTHAEGMGRNEERLPRGTSSVQHCGTRMSQVILEWGRGGHLSEKDFKKGQHVQRPGMEESMDHLGSLQVIHKWWQQKLLYDEGEMHTGLISQRGWVLSWRPRRPTEQFASFRKITLSSFQVPCPVPGPWKR